MQIVTIASGTGNGTLQSAAQQIINQMANDVSGTQYEMTVSVKAPQWAISAQVWSTNQYLRARGVNPWSGNSSVVSAANGTVTFKWVK